MKKEQKKEKGAKETIFIKIYFYLNNGVMILNNFRNLGLGIFALYFALKFTHPLWLVGMVIISVPILVIVGYYNVHKISKISEQLSIKHGTHYGLKQFEYVEEQVKLLKDIKKLLIESNQPIITILGASATSSKESTTYTQVKKKK